MLYTDMLIRLGKNKYNVIGYMGNGACTCTDCKKSMLTNSTYSESIGSDLLCREYIEERFIQKEL